MLQAECKAIDLKLPHIHDPKDRIFTFQTSELLLWVQNENISKRQDQILFLISCFFSLRVQLAIINIFIVFEKGEPSCEPNIEILQPFKDMISRIYVISDDQNNCFCLSLVLRDNVIIPMYLLNALIAHQLPVSVCWCRSSSALLLSLKMTQ